VRIGPNDVISSNPDITVRCGKSKSLYVRSPSYQSVRFRPGADNMLSMRDNEAHSKLKAKTSAGVCLYYRDIGNIDTDVSL
jgi:hypothetical protein